MCADCMVDFHDRHLVVCSGMFHVLSTARYRLYLMPEISDGRGQRVLYVGRYCAEILQAQLLACYQVPLGKSGWLSEGEVNVDEVRRGCRG